MGELLEQLQINYLQTSKNTERLRTSAGKAHKMLLHYPGYNLQNSMNDQAASSHNPSCLPCLHVIDPAAEPDVLLNRFDPKPLYVLLDLYL